MNIKKFLIGTAAGALMLGATIVPAFADSVNVNFENPPYALGTINAQDSWSSLGAAGSGCAVYDHAVNSSLGTTGFGSQSLRVSNAVTSGCFGDQTFSKSLVNEAGEANSINSGMSGGAKQKHFEASWDFASTVPGTEQPGLSVVASPDRGDGARMSWVQMKDTPTGLEVNFYDYQDAIPYGDSITPTNGYGPEDNFIFTNLVSNLDRTVSHNIKITMDLLDGPRNDIVKVYVDGVLKHTGTSWEDYFRFVQGPGGPEWDGIIPGFESRTVDSILFRTGGAAAPATAGFGFLIDNLSTLSGPILVGPPTNKDQCKKDGWKTFNNPTFSNQGQCVKFVENHEVDDEDDDHENDDDDRDDHEEDNRDNDHRGENQGRGERD